MKGQLLAAGCLFFTIVQSIAAVVSYPAKPIRLVVPAAPGGGMDATGRFVAQRLSDALGQTVVVDNRAGAGSAVGTGVVAKAAADGYTLLLAHNAIAMLHMLYAKLPFDNVRDFAPVAIIGSTTHILVVNPTVPAKNVRELIALSKARPGSLNFANTGTGGTSTLAMDYFKLMTGADLVNVPFNGTTPSLISMVAGQTQVMLSPLPGAVPFIDSKRLIALATSGLKRSTFRPELPTLNEAGVTGYEFDTWYGVFAPAQTPKVIIGKLNGAIDGALARPEIKQQLANQGIEAGGGTTEAFAKFVHAEVDKMARIIKASGSRPE